jgi:hypothetical protein
MYVLLEQLILFQANTEASLIRMGESLLLLKNLTFKHSKPNILKSRRKKKWQRLKVFLTHIANKQKKNFSKQVLFL